MLRVVSSGEMRMIGGPFDRRRHLKCVDWCRVKRKWTVGGSIGYFSMSVNKWEKPSVRNEGFHSWPSAIKLQLVIGKDMLLLTRHCVICFHAFCALTMLKQRFTTLWLTVQHWPLTCSCKEWVRFPSELDTWHLYTPEIFLVTEVKDKEPLWTWRGRGWR